MTVQQKIIKNKVGLIELAKELGSVSKACKIMGFSRDTFYRYKELVEEGGIDNLVDRSRRKPNLRNRVADTVEKAVVAMAFDFPAYGQVRVSNELRKQGVFVSTGGVRSVWLRHNLETFKKRLTLYPFYECLLIEGQSIVASKSSMTISFLLQSTTSTTQKQKQCIHRRTESAKDFTRQYCKSFTRWHFGKRYIAT